MKTTNDVKPTLNYLRQRTLLMVALTASAGNLAAARDMFEANKSPTAEIVQAAETRMRDLLKRSRNGDQSAKVELNELRITVIDLYMRAASSFGTSCFNIVNLANTQEPAWQNTYRAPIRIKSISQDGAVSTTMPVKAKRTTIVPMDELAPDEIEYQMRDIQRGEDVAQAAQATVDIAWDLQRYLDKLAFTLMKTLYGAFNQGGSKLLKTWIQHPDIVTANLPTTNDLVAAGTTSSTKFRLAVFSEIVRYCESWGQAFGMPLTPTGVIYIPSKDIVDMASEVTATGLPSNNSIIEGVLRNYRQFGHLNVNWTLIPDATLPSGICYPVLNMPVGEIYFKPGFDQEWVESFPKLNLERRGITKPYAMFAPEAWRVRTCRVTYHT